MSDVVVPIHDERICNPLVPLPHWKEIARTLGVCVLRNWSGEQLNEFWSNAVVHCAIAAASGEPLFFYSEYSIAYSRRDKKVFVAEFDFSRAYSAASYSQDYEGRFGGKFPYFDIELECKPFPLEELLCKDAEP